MHAVSQCTRSRFHPNFAPPQLNATMIMEEALAELDALDSNNDICYAEIAKKHSVARSTLSRKHRGVSGSRAEPGLARRNLQPEQEAELVKYIEALTERKLPPTREMVQIYASDIAGHPVSHSPQQASDRQIDYQIRPRKTTIWFVIVLMR